MSWRDGQCVKVCNCTLPYTNPKACETCGNSAGFTFTQEHPDAFDLEMPTVDGPGLAVDPGKILATAQQPPPIITPKSVDVTIRVVQDLLARSDMGLKKYGSRLKVFNGRDALVDAYQEALDLCCYLKQELLKREAASINQATEPERGV